MLPIAITNVILAVGVTVMVVTPLVWAILTQHRDHPGPAVTARATPRQPAPQPRRHTPRPRTRRSPLAGRA
jgi:hypothetical protein